MKFVIDMLGQLLYLAKTFEFVTIFVPRLTQLLQSGTYVVTVCVLQVSFFTKKEQILSSLLRPEC